MKKNNKYAEPEELNAAEDSIGEDTLDLHKRELFWDLSSCWILLGPQDLRMSGPWILDL